MEFFITVLTIAAILTSSEAGPEGRITFGKRAEELQFLYQVGIAQGSHARAQVHCGGTLISNYWVLTAAHCVNRMSELNLRFGSTNFSAPEVNKTIHASKFHMHPNFNPMTLENDIALIKIPYITYTHKIYKVSLPSISGTPDLEGMEVIGSGWGQDESGYPDRNNLKWAKMRVRSINDCKPHFPNGFIKNTTLCVDTSNGVSTCFGDSGGPLVLDANKMLVGVTSFVMHHDSCIRGIFAGFARVTKYLEWIARVTGVHRP